MTSRTMHTTVTTLSTTIIGVCGVRQVEERPVSLHVVVEVCGEVRTTSPARAVQHAASHALAATFDHTTSFPVHGAEAVTLSLYGGARLLGKAVFEATPSGANRKHNIPLLGSGGEVHIIYSLGEATVHNRRTQAIRPHSALRRGSSRGQRNESFDAVDVEPLHDPCIDRGPGVLSIHVTGLRAEGGGGGLFPTMMSVSVAYAGCERHGTAGTVGGGRKPKAAKKLDMKSDFDLVYSDAARYVHFTVWGRGGGATSTNTTKPPCLYEKKQLGTVRWPLRNSVGKQTATALAEGFEITFTCSITYQRTLQEGSSGRPTSAYPKKRLQAFDVKQAVQVMDGETNHLLERADRPLSADEVELDFDKQDTSVQDTAPFLSNMLTQWNSSSQQRQRREW